MDPQLALYDVELFRQRLSETIAWCSAHVNVNDAENCLRTPALKPEAGTEIDEGNVGDFKVWTDFELMGSVVTTLADRRARLLVQSSLSPAALPDALAAGRVLLCDVNSTPWDGLAETETNGFLSVSDIPAWDTWLWVVDSADSSHEVLLLSWVPGEFVERVTSGIWVNCFDSSAWAEDRAAAHPFLTKLKSDGLLGSYAAPEIRLPPTPDASPEPSNILQRMLRWVRPAQRR